MQLWQWSALFLLAAAALGWAGTSVAHTGDEIAERTRLGGLLVGMLLVAAATSLPEIATVMGAAAAAAPNLAVGSLLGSSMANMAILAVLALTHRQARVWTSVEPAQAQVALLAMLLTAFVAIAIATPVGVRVGWIGLDSLLVLLLYVAAVARINNSRRSRAAPSAGALAQDGSKVIDSDRRWLRPALWRFGIAALVILVAGPTAALAGKGIVETSGLSETFVGVLFLALATSLPELLASIGAVRIGAHDLAVGNLFGSNSFNMVVVLFADLAYLPGPILRITDPAQIVAVAAAIALMAIPLATIVGGKATKRRFEPAALVVLLVYAASLALISRP
ncbi:MAG: hypothetical protein KY393_04620 [Actinobacteria bacterium]|nr:hypothetical protein [Actinomycetota bacterium]